MSHDARRSGRPVHVAYVRLGANRTAALNALRADNQIGRMSVNVNHDGTRAIAKVVVYKRRRDRLVATLARISQHVVRTFIWHGRDGVRDIVRDESWKGL